MATSYTVTDRRAVFGGDPFIGPDGGIEGEYRYRLDRDLAPTMDSRDGLVVWVMLNPSTADHRRDDQTIRRCMGYTHRFGYHRLSIVNLYALRSRDPAALAKHPAPCGPDNDDAIRVTALEADLIIAAWGSDRMVPPRAATVVDLLDGLPVWCLGVNKDGQPKHPCYLDGDLPLVPFNDAARGIVRFLDDCPTDEPVPS